MDWPTSFRSRAGSGCMGCINCGSKRTAAAASGRTVPRGGSCQRGRFRLGRSPGDRGAFGWVAPGRAVLQYLDTAAFGVEGDGVDVDPAVRRVSEDEPGRPLVLVDGEAEVRKGSGGAVAVAEGHHDVEVVVGSGLFVQQGIDAPAAVEPDRNAGGVETGDDLDDVIRVYHVGDAFPFVR